MWRWVVALCVVILPAPTLSAQSAYSDPAPGDPIPPPTRPFPDDNWWNLKITNAVLHPNSTTIMNNYGSSPTRDFGIAYGIPFITVSQGYPTTTLKSFFYLSDSDQIGYPIPTEAQTQGWSENSWALDTHPVGGDHHTIMVDTVGNKLWELYQAHHNTHIASESYGGTTLNLGEWAASSGAYWDMSTNNTRGKGLTSGEAAGLQMYPGLAKSWEVYPGTDPIRHAVRITVNLTASNWYVWPATHSTTAGGIVPLGSRFRLKSSFDFASIPISSCPAEVKKMLQAFKDYGVIVADNGTTGQIQGNQSPDWEVDLPQRANYPLSQWVTNCFSYMHLKDDFELIDYGWGENLEHTVTPGDTYVRYRFGASHLPYDQSCTVTLQDSGGSTITTNTLSTGLSKRETSFTGLTPSTNYKIVADCGGYVPTAGDAFSADSFTTTAATSSGNRTIPITVTPSTVLSSAARVTVDYGTTSSVADGSVQNTSCTNAGGGCTVNLTLPKGVEYWRVRWQDSSNNVLATGLAQALTVK